MENPRTSAVALLPILLAFQDAPLPAAEAAVGPRLEQVVIVFKTHFDIGYTDMAREVVRRYRTSMIDEALQVSEANRDVPRPERFVWTMPGWPLWKILEDWEGQTPERKGRILEAFREGRFVVHALPFTTHTELLDLPDLERGLLYASRLSRMAGLSLPRDSKMTDVPCHSWAMPTLLRHAGVDFLHLGCNAASRSPQVPALFFWEGPDGSRLLTMYTAESYGTGLLPPAGWPYRTWLALIHTGDNHGPPKPDEVRAILAEAKEKLPGVGLRIGRLSDFADAILAEKAEVPVVRGDMPDTWIHGPLCDPRGAAIARSIRPAIAIAEGLHSHLRAWGIDIPDPAEAISRACEGSLLYGEHTWGGALYWVASYTAGRRLDYGEAWKKGRAEGKFKRLEESWDEHTAYIETARDIILPLLEQGMKALALSVSAPGGRVVVYNPLPWKRDGLVSFAAGGAGIDALKPLDGDEVLPLEGADGLHRFVAHGIPAMGYRTYVPVKAEVPDPRWGTDPDAGVLENAFFRVVLDTSRGAIRSLVDKRSGRELAGETDGRGFGQYLYERFDRDRTEAFVKAYVKIDAPWALNELGKPDLPPSREVPYREGSPGPFSLRFKTDPVSAIAEMAAPGGSGIPHPVTARVTLYRDQPFVDLEVVLEGKPADPWPEAGWLCLPAQVADPRFRLGRLGGIVDPARDVVPGSNRHLFGLSGGLAIIDPRGTGIGLCPLDTPLVSLGEPGCWQFSMDYVPSKPAAYLNLFNNQWTTNFRLWNEGTWRHRVRIWAIDSYDADRGWGTPSLEARFPLQAAFADGAAGKLPPSERGLELARRGIQVTAFGPNPDGPGTLLRLWELSGVSGRCEVRLPAALGARSVQPADGRGRPLGPPMEVRNSAFEAPIRAFAPASFIIPSTKKKSS